MPGHRHRHRKNLRYWLKKIFPFLNSKRYRRYQRKEEEPVNVRFLTMEEVKASRELVPDQEPIQGNTPESFVLREDSPVPRSSYSGRSRRRKKDFKYWIRKFFRNIFFISFKRKRAHSSQESYRFLSIEEIKKAQEQTDTSTSWHPESPLPEAGGLAIEERAVPESRKRRRHRHHRKGIFRFFRKKHRKPSEKQFTPEEFKLPEKKENVPFSIYIRPVINSTALFLIAYQVSWFFYQFSVMVVASFSRIDSVLFYYEVMFPIGNHSPKWTQANIIAITLAGPLFSILMAAIYRFVILRKLHPGGQMRSFLVWLYLTSIMLFLGAFVGGAITRQGFGYVVDWLYMNIAFRILLSMIFLSLIIWASWRVVAHLPEVSGTDSWKSNRYAYVTSRLIIPWFIGSVIMVLLKITPVIPQHENIFNYDAINLATLAFAVIPPLFNSKTRPHLMQNKKTYVKPHRSTIAAWVLIAIALTLLIRIGLANGLYFKFQISLDMGRYYI